MKDLKTSMMTNKKTFLYLMTFILFELIIRTFLQPDPWLLRPGHWYFHQPMRLLLELGFVTILTIIIYLNNKKDLTIEKNHMSLLVLASLISIVVFSILEIDQLKESFSVGYMSWIMWYLTGFFIGIGQELLYRGLLYDLFKKRMTRALTFAFVTLFFLIMPLHSIRLYEYFKLGEYSVVILLTIIYASASLFFTWLRYKTRSVTIPAIVHGFGNAITWVAVFAIL